MQEVNIKLGLVLSLLWLPVLFPEWCHDETVFLFQGAGLWGGVSLRQVSHLPHIKYNWKSTV